MLSIFGKKIVKKFVKELLATLPFKIVNNFEVICNLCVVLLYCLSTSHNKQINLHQNPMDHDMFKKVA